MPDRDSIGEKRPFEIFSQSVQVNITEIGKGGQTVNRLHLYAERIMIPIDGRSTDRAVGKITTPPILAFQPITGHGLTKRRGLSKQGGRRQSVKFLVHHGTE